MQIVDLNLDNSKSSTVIGLSDQYKALRKLSLANVGLTSLKVLENRAVLSMHAVFISYPYS